MPPLGLLYIAAYLRRHLGTEVLLLDAKLDRGIESAVAAALREFRPDAVGISALTAESFLAHKLAAAVKAADPGMPVVIGGPYATSDPEGALADAALDAAVIGEGELTFAELLRLIISEGPRWKDPALLRAVDGLAFRGEDGAERSRPRAPIADLDALPFPAWDLVDYRKFWAFPSMATLGERPYLPLFASRGCPYHCAFCHNIFGKTFRPRSPENVADEVAMLHGLGVRDIEVLDDIANCDPERFDRTLQLLLDRGLHSKLSFPNALRGDLLRESSADLLKGVGTGEISVAVETASERLQSYLGKNLSLPKVSQAIDMLADRRIFTRGFFILGLPTETPAELRSTIEFAARSRLHLAMFFTPNPFPGTKFREMFRSAGKLPASEKPIDFEYFGAPFNGSTMSDREYRLLYRWAYIRFYADPVRAFRVARDGGMGLGNAFRRATGLFRNYASFRSLRED